MRNSEGSCTKIQQVTNGNSTRGRKESLLAMRATDEVPSPDGNAQPGSSRVDVSRRPPWATAQGQATREKRGALSVPREKQSPHKARGQALRSPQELHGHRKTVRQHLQDPRETAFDARPNCQPRVRSRQRHLRHQVSKRVSPMRREKPLRGMQREQKAGSRRHGAGPTGNGTSKKKREGIAGTGRIGWGTGAARACRQGRCREWLHLRTSGLAWQEAA